MQRKRAYYYEEEVELFNPDDGYLAIVHTLQHPFRSFFIEASELTEEPRPKPVDDNSERKKSKPAKKPIRRKKD